jgi:hypothetical protein
MKSNVYVYIFVINSVLPLDLRPYANVYAFGGFGGYPYSDPASLVI